MVLSGVTFWDEGDDTLFGSMDSSSDSESENDKKQPNKRNQKKGKPDDDRFEPGGHKPLKNVLAT